MTDRQVNNIFDFLYLMIIIMNYDSNEGTDNGVGDRFGMARHQMTGDTTNVSSLQPRTQITFWKCYNL